MLSLLKFITCGSVDDGKSTLIGHMLYDAKLLFADQKRALELESTVGSRSGKIDYSLLLDGLIAEREQGITIDVAYRYFKTEKRSFIVADTPGHEEYTRNMAVGASFAELAVILLDASKGVLTQTKRHTRICALMGIRNIVFAVNKMDVVNYSQETFKRIRKEILTLSAEFEFDTMSIIPVSATAGDNITSLSQRMKWYRGKPLLTYLEDIDVKTTAPEEGFVMPIQRVSRPNRDFRGFQGQISCGVINTGDEIETLPSREKAKITKILNGNTEVSSAQAGQSVTLCLSREIDLSRGSVIYKDTTLGLNSLFSATLLCMNDTPVIEGKNYYLQLGTRSIPVTVMDIEYKIDINDGTHLRSERLYKNEIARCNLSASEKIAIDSFARHRDLGCFILIDRVTNATAACGVVEHTLRRDDNLTWHKMDITREFRCKALSQQARTIWLTGLSGSGKSTLANALEKSLAALGLHTMLLDGDNVRMGLNNNLGFKEEDRIENIRRIAEVSKLMNDAGLIVITSFISPYHRDRENARNIIGEKDYIEIYVSTPIEECERRDVKGLYRKARAGEIPNFTGVNSPYEKPVSPDIIINTAEYDVETCTSIIMEKLKPRLGID